MIQARTFASVFALVAFSSFAAFAQTRAPRTITVDVTPSHQLNAFVPNRALGAGVDRLPYGAVDKLYTAPVLTQMLSAGWQPVSYRQNTELHAEAWHWNPDGKWSDPGGRGYFTGSATPGGMIRHSYGYPLPHRGVTRNDGTETVGYSRLTDGDMESYWKSNPYLTRIFTGEDDSLHPQWVILDLATAQNVDTIRIAWADPYAKRYLVQYWTGTQDPVKFPTKGVWQTFPAGEIARGQGGRVTIRVADALVPIEFIRIWMTESSNTCDTHGVADPRNCVGYAIREISVGTAGPRGEFHDLTQHVKDQEQTATYCSSIDPWHDSSDLDEHAGDQTGFDLFYTSGVTRGLPVMVPIAMLYGTPEDAAAEIAYLEKRAYPISYVEMGEEPDGQYMLPEDYGALYVEFAAALHKVDPNLKLGGPVFQGVNKDIEVWPDASGKASWLGRFLDYLKSHGKLGELAFMSYEHYPIEPCKLTWASLYDEADLVSNMVRIWRSDGLSNDVPQFITESNIAWQASESFVDVYGALWLADYVGAYLSAGGSAVYYFHYFSLGVHPGCNASPGTFGMFTTNADLQVQQFTSQYFASQLINLEWVQPGDGLHKLFPAASDIRDSAGHVLVTAYAALRPDGEWSLLIVNKDQENSQPAQVVFHDSEKNRDEQFSGEVHITEFGRAQYAWHPNGKSGSAGPDGPAARSTVEANASTIFDLPKASVTVIRGVLAGSRK